MKDRTWILVANNVQARVLESLQGRPLTELESIEHPEGHLHEGDLIAAKPGRMQQRTGIGSPRNNEPKRSARDNQALGFAKHLSSYLYSAQNEGKFERLYIVASPSVLGMLRQQLKQPTLKLVAGEVSKDLITRKPEEIREHLPFVL